MAVRNTVGGRFFEGAFANLADPSLFVYAHHFALFYTSMGGACCLYRVSPPFVPSAIPILLYSVYAQVEGSRFGVPKKKLLLSEFFRELLYQWVAVSDIASRRVFPNQSLLFRFLQYNYIY